MYIIHVVHKSTRILYVSILLVYIPYVLYESMRIVYVSILHVYILYALHVSTKAGCAVLYVLCVSTRILYLNCSEC